MQSSVCREPSGNFGVALQALQRGLPSKFVTACTIGRSVQQLVRTRPGAAIIGSSLSSPRSINDARRSLSIANADPVSR